MYHRIYVNDVSVGCLEPISAYLISSSYRRRVGQRHKIYSVMLWVYNYILHSQTQTDMQVLLCMIAKMLTINDLFAQMIAKIYDLLDQFWAFYSQQADCPCPACVRLTVK